MVKEVDKPLAGPSGIGKGKRSNNHFIASNADGCADANTSMTSSILMESPGMSDDLAKTLGDYINLLDDSEPVMESRNKQKDKLEIRVVQLTLEVQK